jgi:hypothetical protein
VEKEHVHALLTHTAQRAQHSIYTSCSTPQDNRSTKGTLKALPYVLRFTMGSRPSV